MKLKDSRVLVTGCGGMLGTDLLPRLTARCPSVLATDKVIKPGLVLMDVRDGWALSQTFIHWRPDVVLHLAAETDLEFCEKNLITAQHVNASASAMIAHMCNWRGCLMVHVSTVGVFGGGKETPYDETDVPSPVNVYGRTKLAGEERVRELCPRHLILRAGWMMGGGPGVDHKFIGRVEEQLRSGAKKVYAVSDKLGTPTLAGDFSDVMLDLIEAGLTGTFHAACHGEGTRYDVAREMVQCLGYNDVEVVPVTSEYFKDTYSARRPRSESMTNAALRAAGMDRMRPWRDALRDYLTRFAKGTAR